MAKLIPLSEIPYSARAAESKARKSYETRAKALEAATYEVVEGPGTFSGAFPGSIGRTCTKAAAEACASQVTRMPGNTSFHPYSFKTW